METDQTVLYLTPVNEFALDIKLCLRIGLDQESKNLPYLASFGRRHHNDIILNNYFPRTDQCYFEFNKESGELLLHDISKAGDTQLTEIKKVNNEDEDENSEDEDEDEDSEDRDEEIMGALGCPQIWKAPRQCVVLLGPDLYHDRIEWLFKIRHAEFRLIPGPTQLTEEKVAFARNTNNDKALEVTLQPRGTLDLQPDGSLALELRSTCFRASPKQKNDKAIRFRKLKLLGGGGQAEVYKVVDMYTGTHYACKIIDVGKMATEWKNATGKDYRTRLKQENSEFSPNFEIFMPVCEGSLHDLLRESRERGLREVQAMISQMLYQMFQALDFVHSHDPPIIHRDIKPPNILFRGDNFLLTDFGIAKAVDASKTFIGSGPYMAPEVRESRQQTPKIDIWALGVTVVECLEKPEDFDKQAKGDRSTLEEYSHWEVKQFYDRLCKLLDP
ncbi:IPL1-Ser/thr protein kinase [Fusarium bulbicola]|nr:IPL1-Ser/thr protein kinase [Fusarium bulbicola]